MGPTEVWAGLVVVLAIVSVALSVSGLRILGRATNVIVAGVFQRHGHRLRSCTACCVRRLHLRRLGAALLPPVLDLAGVVQRTMFQPAGRHRGEDPPAPAVLHRPPACGDLLSRVTNDIDNVAQSLQQTLSQMLTSTLTIVGVLVMMFTISWELALIALVTVPLSLWDGEGHRPALKPGSSPSGATPAPSTPRSRRPSPVTP